MENLRVRRGTKRAQSTRIVNLIKVALNAKTPDLEDIKGNLDYLEDLHREIDEFDSKVADQMYDDAFSTEDTDKEADEAADYKRRFMIIKAKITALMYPKPSSSSSDSYTTVAEFEPRKKFRLPEVELKKFSGDIKEWIGFWSQFRQIHENTEIDTIDKFQYLVQSMVKGSRAEEVIGSYPQSPSNYQKAVTALQTRFGREEILVEVYVRELLKLVVHNINSTDKMTMSKLFDKLEMHLRALESLGVTSDKYAAMLYPLVESALTEDILRAWQRSSLSSVDGSKSTPPKSRLDLLMDFLRTEVFSEERIALARDGFMAGEADSNKGLKSSNKGKGNKTHDHIPTLAGFHISDSNKCLFCDRTNHESKDCYTARKMTNEEKKNKLKEARVCFACLKPRHITKDCRAKIKCPVCGRKHCTIMCEELEKQKCTKVQENPVPTDSSETNSQMSNQVCTAKVVLQTLMVTLIGNGKQKKVRAFLDSGCQRSYVLQRTAQELGLISVAEEKVSHILFGGTQTNEQIHKRYLMQVQKPETKFCLSIEVRDQVKISNAIPQISRSSVQLFHELKKKKVWISDVGDSSQEIELLIGADHYGSLLTGKVVPLDTRLTAIETKLGWVLSGENSEASSAYSLMSSQAITQIINAASVADLWELDTIGIQDDVEVKTIAEVDKEAQEKLLQTMTRDETGRYVVQLPWIDGHPQLPTNKNIAEKRLQRATKKLIDSNLYDLYDNIFMEWEQEGFIEKVQVNNEQINLHYLPHRPVIKTESLTTPVRPVFDASCKMGKAPSLNDCLHKGTNYVKLIPDVLLRFRERNVGVISDIRKAFQMIGVAPNERDFLRFIWWEDYQTGTYKIYRHARVVFGATCSPFILGAVLDFHLSRVNGPWKSTADQLKNSLYVDNCVASVNTHEEYETFRKQAMAIMNDAKMELRLWMTNTDDIDNSETVTPVLGLLWNRKKDTLSLDVESLKMPDDITKRSVLSAVHRIFDPLGLVCPAVLSMKLLLQDTWVHKMKWDEALPLEKSLKFQVWMNEVKYLNTVEIPRVMTNGEVDRSKWTLHTFTDASKIAYAAVVYLRIDHGDSVTVKLLYAKNRVAPLKKITIPRLELLGCLIGSRLALSVKKALELDIPEFYWSDSSTALAWIKRNEAWGTFVGNRVKEINQLTHKGCWRHVPGLLNPADLPSRGCSPCELLKTEYWNGPDWLRLSVGKWPVESHNTDEGAVNVEKKKGVVTCMTGLDWNKKKNYTFTQTVRITAWMLRFCKNSKIKRKSDRLKGLLSHEEIACAEKRVIYSVQLESFPETEKVKGLVLVRDEEGLLRIKTRIVMRNELVDFIFPLVLPKKHEIVDSIIMEKHHHNCHAGVQTMMVKLRENYWIIQSRKTIMRVLNKCLRCKKFKSRSLVLEMPPLPLDRIKDAEVYEVVGVDLAGPLFLKNGSKAWMVIFTCAVYRAVHLEVVMSLSTAAFIEALKKFVLLYRRPTVIYCDNGTNFVGTYNAFKKLNWKEIQRDHGLSPISFKFSAPLSAWWGGWWERLIRVVKELLWKTVGNGSLSKVELQSILSEIEEVVNGRPLTYVSDNPEDLVPLTPSMFLKKEVGIRLPESTLSESEKMQFRYKHVQDVRRRLQSRFREEYLSQLLCKPKGKLSRELKVGEVVLVSSDDKKRLHWPMGRILELFPGKDGISRCAKVKTKDGIFLRSYQRLYPLELFQEDHDILNEGVRTRSGRVVKKPDFLNL